jgi:nitrite reductase (NAD(P)H)
MSPMHLQNQDTNDRLLGNIQRNGTFSVIPRIAAGEITPDGLIAIGQVAKKYGLYTKVSKWILWQLVRPLLRCK